jgi:hypothetical protein
MQQLIDLDREIDTARNKLSQMEVEREQISCAMDLLSKKKGFKPESAGFKLVYVDAFSKMAVYHHDTFKLPKGKLALQHCWGGGEWKYRLSFFYPPREKFGGEREEIYAGNITSKKHFTTITDEMVKFKLMGDEVVECKTQAERQRIIDVYLTLSVPKEYFYDVVDWYYPDRFPNFRWKYSRQQQKKAWENPDTSRANSYLQPIAAIDKLPPWEKHEVLSVDEFIKRLKNHERGD